MRTNQIEIFEILNQNVALIASNINLSGFEVINSCDNFLPFFLFRIKKMVEFATFLN